MVALSRAFRALGILGSVWVAAAACSSADTGDANEATGAAGGAAGGAGLGGASGGAAGGAGLGGSAGSPSGGAAGSDGGVGGGVSDAGADAPPGTLNGQFSVLTYNVAGLPQGISKGNPIVNTPLISPLLNPYDLVFVQEDFSYHAQLIASATHPYQSVPLSTGGALGDGLNRLARFQFTDFLREAWVACNGIIDKGSDCLTKKGFSSGLHHLAEGVAVSIYNLHMDAGGGSADYAAREKQTQQLLAAIAKLSPGMAVIVTGDTNMKLADEPVLQTLLTGAGLEDACRKLSCPDPNRIDRIMFRGSQTLTLTPQNWRVDTSFVDAGGQPLSDHEAVGVDFVWVAKPAM